MKFVSFFLFFSFLISCNKVRTIKIPFSKPKVVVNCIFSPDSTWHAHITYTGTFTDTTFKNIDNAKVLITNNFNDSILLSNIGNGNYVNATKPTAGNIYNILVSVPDYDLIPSYALQSHEMAEVSALLGLTPIYKITLKVNEILPERIDFINRYAIPKFLLHNSG